MSGYSCSKAKSCASVTSISAHNNSCSIGWTSMAKSCGVLAEFKLPHIALPSIHYVVTLVFPLRTTLLPLWLNSICNSSKFHKIWPKDDSHYTPKIISQLLKGTNITSKLKDSPCRDQVNPLHLVELTNVAPLATNTYNETMFLTLQLSLLAIVRSKKLWVLPESMRICSDRLFLTLPVTLIVW